MSNAPRCRRHVRVRAHPLAHARVRGCRAQRGGRLTSLVCVRDAL